MKKSIKTRIISIATAALMTLSVATATMASASAATVEGTSVSAYQNTTIKLNISSEWSIDKGNAWNKTADLRISDLNGVYTINGWELEVE